MRPKSSSSTLICLKSMARTSVRDRQTLGPRGSRTPPITRALRLFGQPVPLSLARALIIYARVTYVSAPKRTVRPGYYHALEGKPKVICANRSHGRRNLRLEFAYTRLATVRKERT